MAEPQDSFEELVVRYQDVVCAVAYAVLRDRARSEEVAQEAFLIAWQKLPAMSPPPAMPGWLCGIAKHLAANAARRKKETAMETEPISDDTPLDAVLDREADELARRALASLKEPDREAIVLYYRGSSSVAEVATILGITEPAARQRLHRGRERLRAALGAVETTLRATKPGPAFTAACIAALATRTATAQAAAATTTSAKMKSAFGWPLAALFGLGGIVAVAEATNRAEPIPTTTTTTTTATAGGANAPRVANAPGVAAAPSLVREIDARRKAQLADRIVAARTVRIGSSASAPTLATPIDKVKVYDFSGSALDDIKLQPPKDPTKLTKATMRHAIQGVQPLLLECYGAAYDRLPRKDGVLAVQIRLESEPDVATIVTEAKLAGDAHLLGDAEFNECLHETLLSIELQPMPDGGAIEMHYPFTVSGRRPK